MEMKNENEPGALPAIWCEIAVARATWRVRDCGSARHVGMRAGRVQK